MQNLSALDITGLQTHAFPNLSALDTQSYIHTHAFLNLSSQGTTGLCTRACRKLSALNTTGSCTHAECKQ